MAYCLDLKDRLYFADLCELFPGFNEVYPSSRNDHKHVQLVVERDAC